MRTLIQLDSNIQIPNRILKDGSNLIKQISSLGTVGCTMVQTDNANKPTYNYGGFLSFQGNDGIHSTETFVLRDSTTSEFDIELWWRPTSFAISNIEILFRHGDDSTYNFSCYFNSANKQFVTNLGNINPDTYGDLPLINEWHHLYWSFKNGTNYAYYDGIFQTSGSLSVTNAPYQLHVGRNSNTLYPTNADIAFFKITDTARVTSSVANGTKVFNPVFGKGFNEFERYQDDGFKKLFISSKYLKDAVISQTNVIDTIPSSVNHPVLLDARGATYPTWTNKGIYFDTIFDPTLDAKLNGDTYFMQNIDERSKMLVSYWINPKASTANQYHFFVNTNYTSYYCCAYYGSSTLSIQFGGQTINIPNIVLDNYYHVAIVYDLTYIYSFINGSLVDKRAVTINTRLANWQLHLGSFDGSSTGRFKGYMDDILFVVGSSIIDPTGYSVGEKVFDPPTRGGVDGTFKTDGQPYPEWYVDYLIYNKGYIPISNVSELTNMYTTRVFGAGTKYSGTYVGNQTQKYIVTRPLDLLSYNYVLGIFTNFSGVFDGNNQPITNLLLHNGDAQIGFCRGLAGGTLRNIVLYGTVVNDESAAGYCGGICAFASAGIIENCVFNGSVTSAGGNVAGICGSVESTSTQVYIRNCRNNGTIIGGNAVGGICGNIDFRSNIENCTNYGNVSSTSSSYVGGISARNLGGTIKRCANYGTIYVYAYYAGGISARNESSGIISDCVSHGAVSCRLENAGGAVGSNVSGTITNCFSTGSVTGTTTGGFSSVNSGTITNCYWDTVTSGKATSAGATGKTTSELQTGLIPDTAVFIGWSTSVWWANTSAEYPTLKRLPAIFR